jgi:uncharacterized protein YqgV (UPF0045/DUF77 family)
MTSFHSCDELFEAVRTLTEHLVASGHEDAAAELRSGFSLLNGLTDGWALFLESVEAVRTAHSATFDPADRRALDAIRVDVRRAVYRR